MKSRVTTLVLCLVFPCASTRAEKIDIDPQSERIMEVVLNDQTRATDALIIYPIPGDWVLPLGQLSDALGIAISVSATLNRAEGFILRESNEFRLDVAKCRVDFGNTSETFPCEDVLVYNGDIFVKPRLLQKWLPIDITILPLRSRVEIAPREKLPVQMRREREQLAESRGFREAFDPGFPRLALPRKLLEAPLVDSQLGYNQHYVPGAPSGTFSHNTQISGETLGLETLAFVGGSDQRMFDAGRLQLSRQSPDGGLFGPMNLRKVQFFDVDLPAAPLITNSIPGRGFVFSSYPLENPINFDNHDFEGLLPAGWEVVLYRNDVLLDRFTGDGTGRYIFRNVPLLYGRNIFRLTFFGPHGEQRDEYRTFNVGPDLIQPGRTDYRMGMAMLRDSTQRFQFQFAQNIGHNFTASGGMITDRDSPLSYGHVGLAGVTDLFLVSSNCAFDTLGGKACELGTLTGLGNATFGAKYTRLWALHSPPSFLALQAPLFSAAQRDQIAANVGYILPTTPGLGVILELTKKNFIDGSSTTELHNQLTAHIGNLLWNNDLRNTFAAGGTYPVTGKMDISILPLNQRYQVTLDYTLKQLIDVQAEAAYTVARQLSLGAIVGYEFKPKAPNARITASRIFPWATVGLDVSFRYPADLGVGTFMTISFGRDPREGEFFSAREPITSTGAASVQVFKDLNRNGVRDPDEPLLPGVKLVLNQQEKDVATDESGRALVTGLRPHLPADLAVSYRSFTSDPFLKPAQQGYRFYPRLGKTAIIDFPIIVVGQIDGYVNLRRASETVSKGGLKVELVDSCAETLRSAKTDGEGFYSFEDVAPGTYWVRVNPAQVAAAGFRAAPERQEVTILQDGSFESLPEFILDRR